MAKHKTGGETPKEVLNKIYGISTETDSKICRVTFDFKPEEEEFPYPSITVYAHRFDGVDDVWSVYGSGGYYPQNITAIRNFISKAKADYMKEKKYVSKNNII